MFALALGGTGLVAMAATGLAHVGGDSHHPGHDAAVGGSHATGAAHAGQAPSGHAHVGHTDVSHTHSSDGIKSALLSLASPRVLFSLLVGFGLTGVIARPFLGGPLLGLLAVCGALVFEWALVRPLWRFLFRFASNPAVTLEASLMSEARAASRFDENGQGLISVEVDGQIVQCLGTLRIDDRALGVKVRAGDVLRVEDVDAVRSRCIVSYVGHERKA